MKKVTISSVEWKKRWCGVGRRSIIIIRLFGWLSRLLSGMNDVYRGTK
jgi:hypothetical protein